MAAVSDYSLYHPLANLLLVYPFLAALSGKSKFLDLCIRRIVFNGHNNILSSG